MLFLFSVQCTPSSSEGFFNIENILYDETRFSMKESEKGFMHKQTNAQDRRHELLETKIKVECFKIGTFMSWMLFTSALRGKCRHFKKILK